ncbi:helix-turn-helix domain-containing protein [Deinococcus sp. MIMF12]|uniref:Helix-turn-helix domain-containing protein n=1 Tax=Deinococcus rhizophilus TaxID=3049544 RepID=A0ABT7JJJ2_9DEIO|nr:helix-turn-helix domain-containing protein [Deinococcus rhizophilus]MDL2345235.1 helix-turn-helix domain-containing protein [Deinococcus rhizophilus]
MKYGNAAVRRPECGVERTMDVLGGRWTTLIVRELLGGKRRFSELRRALQGISPKTLTARLRDLEGREVLTRTVYAEVPPRVEYTLTPRGEALGEIIAAMARWGSAPDPGEQTDSGEQAASGLDLTPE